MKTEKENYLRVKKLMQKYTKCETIESKCTPEELVIFRKIKSRQHPQNTLTVSAWLQLMLEKKLKNIADYLPSSGYSMGERKKVICGKFSQTVDHRSFYSGKYSGSENHGYVEFVTNYKEVRNIQVIGGLVTYIYKNQKGKLKKCWWLDANNAKNHFKMIKVEGYLYADYHSTNKEKAIEGGKRSEQLKKEAARQKKEYESKKAALQKAYNKALRKQYSFDDSIKAGNCVAGTKAFIIRLQLDESKKYRGKYLLDLAKEKSYNSVPFVERMIRSKC